MQKAVLINMQALKFDLWGNTAFFKKPDVNSYAYFTYNNIPKISLLGILGSIIGLNGYRQQKNDKYPEFYSELKNLKVSIIPLADKGYFSKKIQVFNNTTGFYNKDVKRLPCSLNVREQWLNNPKWQIYILDNNSIDRKIFNRITEYILDRKCEFIPYLGKNNHPANIDKCKIVELNSVNDINYIDSLFDNNSIILGRETKGGTPYQYVESLPVKLDETDNSYTFETLTFTNLNILKYSSNAIVYKHSDKVLYFF